MLDSGDLLPLGVLSRGNYLEEFVPPPRSTSPGHRQYYISVKFVYGPTVDGIWQHPARHRAAQAR